MGAYNLPEMLSTSRNLKSDAGDCCLMLKRIIEVISGQGGVSSI